MGNDLFGPQRYGEFVRLLEALAGGFDDQALRAARVQIDVGSVEDDLPIVPLQRFFDSWKLFGVPIRKAGVELVLYLDHRQSEESFFVGRDVLRVNTASNFHENLLIDTC